MEAPTQPTKEQHVYHPRQNKSSNVSLSSWRLLEAVSTRIRAIDPTKKKSPILMGTVTWSSSLFATPSPRINLPRPNKSSPFLVLYRKFKTRPTFSSLSMSTTGEVSEGSEADSSGGVVVSENDLLVVGPGVLGRLVAEQWRQEHPGCQVYGQTMTTDHHDELIKMGINPSLKGSNVTHRYPYIVFCAPPSRTADYSGDVRDAVLSWNGDGAFVFTSSSAPYDCYDNGACDENSPVVPIGRSPRTDVLLKAEKEVLERDGSVVRLAGLYKADRGAHVYWLSKGTADIRPDHVLNLIHYEDAASLCIAILKKKFRGKIFLGCDNHPLSRQEVMDLVARSGKFSKKFEGFTGTSDPLGKRLNNSKTREEVGWEPKYTSFAEFLGISE